MTHERAIELLKIERECINRNYQPFGKNCDRNCSKCDLVQNPEELLKMYDYVIDAMEKELEQLKEKQNDTNSTAIMMWCVLRSGDDDYEE